MDTLKYFSKTLLHYFLTIIGLGLLSLILYLAGFFYLFQDNLSSNHSPSHFYSRLVQNEEIKLSQDLKRELDQEEVWLMVLNQEGEVIEEHALPQNLNKTYSRSDIASFSRWYLNDYPVFTYIVGDQLMVLGYPQESYARYNNAFQISSFRKLFYLFLVIGTFLLLAFFGIYWRSRLKLLREIAPIRHALQALSQDQIISLDERGNLSEIKAAINQTSHLLQETKEMQSHWIRGVTHDLRSPLTLTLGSAQQLEDIHGPSKQTHQINHSIQRMEDILDNLNLVYLLQGQVLQRDFLELDLTAFLRRIIADFLNNHGEIPLQISLPDQPVLIQANPTLLERAITNTLLNSLKHNEAPSLDIRLEESKQEICLILADSGNISKQMVDELNQKKSNYDIHGMGIIITKQILALHKGRVIFTYRNPGLEVALILPKLKNQKT